MSGVDIDSYRTCMDSTEMEEVVAASVQDASTSELYPLHSCGG